MNAQMKHLIHTDIEDIDLTFFDLFIRVMSAIWGIILFLILPVSLISSLFK